MKPVIAVYNNEYDESGWIDDDDVVNDDISFDDTVLSISRSTKKSNNNMIIQK